MNDPTSASEVRTKVWPVVWAVLTLASMLIGAAAYPFTAHLDDAALQPWRAFEGAAMLAVVLVPLVALVEALVRWLANAKPVNRTRAAVAWAAYAWTVTAWIVLLMGS